MIYQKISRFFDPPVSIAKVEIINRQDYFRILTNFV